MKRKLVMSDYSTNGGAPLPPRHRGSHARPAQGQAGQNAGAGQQVVPQVPQPQNGAHQAGQSYGQPGYQQPQQYQQPYNQGYRPQQQQPFGQQQAVPQGQQAWQQESQGAYRPAGAAYQQRVPSANQFHEGFRAGAGSDFDDDFAAYAPAGDDGLRRVRHKRHKGRRIALIVFAVLFVLIVGSGIALAAYVNSLNTSMGFEDQQEEADLKEALQPASANDSAAENSSAFYMLILGSDSRDEGASASRSDVTMLARIDPDNGKVDLVSIPRDTMVTIEGQGTQKINAAYAFGGAAGAVNAVSTFAGVPITHYCEVHFEELERVVDELGGIWVNVPESFDAGNGGMSFSAGEQRLNGEQALAFARERYNVSGGDFGRAQAQRIVVQAIVKQVLASSPAQLPGLVSSLASSVSTDYSVTDLIALAQQFQSKDLTMYSAVCPSYSLTEDGVSYVCPMFNEWRDMMCRVDAGLDPNDTTAEIPQAQSSNLKLGAASNSPAPKSYEALAASAGLTTNDVAPEQQ